MLNLKYLLSLLPFFNSLRLNKVIGISILLPASYPFLFLSLTSFNPGVQLNAFERLNAKFQSYQMMISVSIKEVSK